MEKISLIFPYPLKTRKKAAEWAEVLGYSQARFIELAVNDKLKSLGFVIKVKISS